MTLFDAQTLGRARRTDPETSFAAARLPGKETLKKRCYDALRAAGTRGLTDFELAEIVGRQQTSAGKRRGELVADGLVEATHDRRPAPSGAMSTVWRVLEAATFGDGPTASQETELAGGS